MSKKETKIEETKEKKPQFEILRHGQRFIVADTFKKAKEALTQAETREETVIVVNFSFQCFPLDGMVAVNRAMEEIYGFSQQLGEPGFFGPRPPQRISIKTGVRDKMVIAAGRLNPPAWQDGFIDMRVQADNPMSLSVYGELKRKFEPSITKIVTLAEKLVKEKSILRGQAAEFDFRWLEAVRRGHPFNPDACAPKFIDISKAGPLYLPRDLEFELQIDVWDVIKRPEDFRYNAIPIKHGVILSGPYGTGKTLFTAVTAQIAVQNGFSFFLLRTPEYFMEAYEMAQFYGPSILSVEDADTIFGGARTPAMNAILEALDGVASKGNEVISIFTTNFPENINEAFMRSGRLDNHIKLRACDGESAGRFIKNLHGEYLDPDVDIEAVGEAFRDLVAADITEGVQKAKRRAIGEFGREIKGKITTDMLINAGDVMRRQRGKGDTFIHPDTLGMWIIRASELAKKGVDFTAKMPSDVVTRMEELRLRDMKRATVPESED